MDIVKNPDTISDQPAVKRNWFAEIVKFIFGISLLAGFIIVFALRKTGPDDKKIPGVDRIITPGADPDIEIFPYRRGLVFYIVFKSGNDIEIINYTADSLQASAGVFRDP